MKAFETSDRYIVRRDRFSNEDLKFIDHYKYLPSERARLAMDMAVRWGMVSAVPDGEDSSGRSRLKILPPTEVVQRAVDTADLLVTALEERGWYEQLPTAAELYETDETP